MRGKHWLTLSEWWYAYVCEKMRSMSSVCMLECWPHSYSHASSPHPCLQQAFMHHLLAHCFFFHFLNKNNEFICVLSEPVPSLMRGWWKQERWEKEWNNWFLVFSHFLWILTGWLCVAFPCHLHHLYRVHMRAHTHRHILPTYMRNPDERTRTIHSAAFASSE